MRNLQSGLALVTLNSGSSQFKIHAHRYCPVEPEADFGMKFILVLTCGSKNAMTEFNIIYYVCEQKF
jgi:hypothetical protein